jgi:hypothetical protein
MVKAIKQEFCNYFGFEECNVLIYSKKMNQLITLTADEV